MTVPRGNWRAERTAPEPARELGFLVLSGIVLREARVGSAASCELLGEGDLIRPWPAGEGEPAVPVAVRWWVLQPLRLAVLDGEMKRRLDARPALYSHLLDGSSARLDRAAVLAAIASERRIDRRVHLLLWHLADRFGKVSPEGVVVPLRLTHETLAKLVRAKRPSVTTALRRLRRAGLASSSAGGWILSGPPPTFSGQTPAAQAASRRV